MPFKESNFLRDQSGMRMQLSTLQQLIELMDPELYAHLGEFLAINFHANLQLTPVAQNVRAL